MKILLVNDDSIQAPAIDFLAKMLKKYGEVIVFAPDVEQSGKSHAMTFFTGLKAEEVMGRDYKCYKVYGTPGDCVRLGLSLYKDIDLVVSGINDGFNIGNDILYSGTVAACFEANLHGVNSIALSSYRHCLDNIYPYVEEVFDYTLNLLKKANKLALLNVNFPREIKANYRLIVTKMGILKDITNVKLKEDGKYHYQEYNLYYEDDINIDYQAIEHGHISITPLTINRTDNELYKLLK